MEFSNDLIVMVNNLAAELAQVKAERDAANRLLREASGQHQSYEDCDCDLCIFLARIASGDPAPKDGER